MAGLKWRLLKACNCEKCPGKREREKQRCEAISFNWIFMDFHSHERIHHLNVDFAHLRFELFWTGEAANAQAAAVMPGQTLSGPQVGLLVYSVIIRLSWFSCFIHDIYIL